MVSYWAVVPKGGSENVLEKTCPRISLAPIFTLGLFETGLVHVLMLAVEHVRIHTRPF